MRCKHCGNEVKESEILTCQICEENYCVDCATDLSFCNECDPEAQAKIKLAEFETKLNALIDEYKMTRKYLIEINGELQVMNFHDFCVMIDSLAEFDGIRPYIIKGRVI
jgi:hypothetical protein